MPLVHRWLQQLNAKEKTEHKTIVERDLSIQVMAINLSFTFLNIIVIKEGSNLKEVP